MDKRFIYSVHDMNRNRLCVLFDSTARQDGEAKNISIKKEMSGWKETSFTLPMYLSDGTPNYRVSFVKPEFLLCISVEDGTSAGIQKDWFMIQEPSEKHEGLKATLDVQCNHLSANLKTKALYVEFDDENGIDTCTNLAQKILAGTGWTLGECDTFYEPDGTTERVRSFTASTKRGAYNLISDLCELFMAYPVYHGDERVVDIHARSNKTGLSELTFGKNMSNVKRTQNSEDIVTKLYVEGEYGDYGYVGIDDAVPSTEISAWRSHKTSSNVQYTYSGTNATIASFSDPERKIRDVIVPPTVEHDGVTYTVTGISNSAFANLPFLQSVTLPDTITRFIPSTFEGTGAFLGNKVIVYGNKIGMPVVPSNVIILPNTVGVSFILNFDYYASIGVWTDEQEEVAVEYYNAMRYYTYNIYQKSQDIQSTITDLTKLMGANWYVVYSGTTPYIYGNGATAANAEIKAGDDVCLVNETTGEYEYVTVESVPYTPPVDRKMIKFGAPIYGTMGALEDGITAATGAITSYTEERDTYDEGTQEWNYYNDLITEITNRKTEMQTTLHGHMLDLLSYMYSINDDQTAVKDMQTDMASKEQYFATIVGEMLREGYWSDTNYIPGQEQALYNDALDISKEMAYPQITYSATLQNIADKYGLPLEYFDINETLRIYDELTGIHDYAFIQTVTEYPDNQKANNISISTDELNIGNKTFGSLLNRITQTADLLKERASIYERARVIGSDDTIGMDVLNGEIDVLKNRLSSTASNWYTDENGNLVFISADNTSAMMLTGQGFMVANGKDDFDNWNWRTFGTGEGFTADMITTGMLRAAAVTILGSNKFYWDSENICIFPDSSDLSKQIRIGHYDLTSDTAYGIGFTTDNGATWQNAISYDGVHFSATNTSDIETMIDGKVQSAESRMSSSLEQTADSITATFTEEIGKTNQSVSDLSGDVQTIQTYIRISNDGITIGKLGSPFTSRFDNEKLSFLENNNEVAYISNKKLYITSAEAATMAVGNSTNGYLVQESYSDGVGFVWRDGTNGN